MSESRPPACCRDLLDHDLRERAREELNVLYVAMTRARRTLVISACEPYRDSGRSLWKRLEPHAQPAALGQLCSTGPTHRQSAIVDPVVPMLPMGPVAGAATGSLVTDPPGEDAARVGLAMHRLLEWGSAQEHAVRSAAREFGLDAAQAERAAESARRILQGEGAWIWQNEHLNWQGSEVELVHDGRLHRLDRLVQHRDGTWWVIDHKSKPDADRDAALREQIRGYARAIAALHPGQTVRGAFLTPQGRLLEVDLDLA